jgi:hypothetical protein
MESKRFILNSCTLDAEPIKSRPSIENNCPNGCHLPPIQVSIFCETKIQNSSTFDGSNFALQNLYKTFLGLKKISRILEMEAAGPS